MPLLHLHTPSPNHVLAIWQLDEAEALAALARTRGLDLQGLEEIKHPQRYRESVAGRLALYEAGLLQGLSLTRLQKDSHGKPHVTDAGWHVSITHSSDYAAALLSPSPCGLDIEPIRPKLNRVCAKFLSAAELSHAADRTEYLCVYWTAKEAIYKLHGRRQLIFKEDIAIAPFHIQPAFQFYGSLHHAGQSTRFLLHGLSLPGYQLSYTSSEEQG